MVWRLKQEASRSKQRDGAALRLFEAATAVSPPPPPPLRAGSSARVSGTLVLTAQWHMKVAKDRSEDGVSTLTAASAEYSSSTLDW